MLFVGVVLEFDVVSCVLLWVRVVVGVVRCGLSVVGCCMLSVVVLRGPLFVVGTCCCWLVVVGCCWRCVLPFVVGMVVRVLLFCVVVGVDGCCGGLRRYTLFVVVYVC